MCLYIGWFHAQGNIPNETHSFFFAIPKFEIFNCVMLVLLNQDKQQQLANRAICIS